MFIPLWNRLTNNLKHVEHEGFFQGSQGCPPTNGLKEVEHHFAQKKALITRKSLPAIADLEARLSYTERVHPEITARWNRVRAEIGDDKPSLVIPLCLLFAGLLAMAAESLMLAPSLDMLSIVEPVEQKVAALAIGCVCATLFHLAFDSLHAERLPRIMTALVRVFGFVAFLSLIILGIVRGQQIAFGATLNDNPLAQFLASSPLLTSIVFAFLTVTFPLAGALAFTFGLRTIRDWKEYTAAFWHHRSATTDLTALPKQITTLRTALEQQTKELENTQKELQHAYLVHHERGTQFGTVQMPAWMVWLRAVLLALVVLFLCALIFGMQSPMDVVCTLAALIAGCIDGYYRRIHPRPSQTLRHHNVQFRQPGESR